MKDDTPTGSEIPSNYRHISGNVYAVYNENGVIIGYKERTVDKDGNYQWKDCDKPKETTQGNVNITSPNGGNGGGSTATSAGNSDNAKPTTATKPSTGGGSGGGNIVAGPDGTYTQTETIVSTETKGGWVITYQTIVTRTYDSKGELLSTKKEGPVEISRVKASDSDGNSPDKSKIKGTMSEELARVKVGLNYNTSLAQEVLTEINAERAAAGIGSLSMSSKSDASLLSQIRAADMAIYNHSDYDSPMYGTLAEMCQTFGVTSATPSEILWKTSADKTASAIAARLKIMSDNTLTNSLYKTIGISIVSKGGYYYVDVVLT